MDQFVMLKFRVALLGCALAALPQVAQAVILAPILMHKPHSGGGYTGPTDTLSTIIEYWGLDANSSAYRGSKSINLCNVSDVVCADVNTDATTGLVPNTPVIGGVTCGTTSGVNLCTVKTWYGQAGVTNQTQATIANRATFTPSCIGSNPCATSTTTTFYESGNVAIASQPYTYITAAQRTGNTSTETVIMQALAASVTVIDWFNSPNQVVQYAGVVNNVAGTDNVFHTIQAVFNNLSSVIAVDSTIEAPADAGANGVTTGQPYYIMGNNSSTGMTGYFLGAGIWSTGATTGQLTTINTNYHSRWGY